MNNKMLQMAIHYTLYEMNNYIHILYQVDDIYTRNLLLNQLWNKVVYLQSLNQFLTPCKEVPSRYDDKQTPVLPANPKTFTIEELATYNGKNGQPAYVAVDGTVYDVTNNAAWAAASHFGLTAGKNLSNEFQSCHSGQKEILAKLKVVGRLTS